MFTWLNKRSDSRRKARELYGAVVTQARDPAFYRTLSVADTPEGRYELIAVHLILVLERLGRADVGDEELRREVLETFVTDMDDAMREMGVSDVRVPKNVKKAAGGVYARGVTYRDALGDGDNVRLQVALNEHVYRGTAPTGSTDLATYVRRAAAHLASEPADALRAGRVTFPPVILAVGARDEHP